MCDIKNDNRGAFTVEVVFVMLILIGVIFTMLYVSLFFLDEINVECIFRDDIRKQEEQNEIKGILGQGESVKETDSGLWCSIYQLEYDIPELYPLVSNYLNNGYKKISVDVRLCSKDAKDFIRMYEALSNEE